MSHSSLPSHGHRFRWTSLAKKTAVADLSTVSTSVSSSEKGPEAHMEWLPYTLRPLFLGIVATFALALSITLVVLCWHSSRNNGLGDDDGSASLLFAWRYLPTIIAVLFTLSMVMIFEDVIRTEPFARLAHPTSVDAKHTLLYKPKSWFKTMTEGFSRQHTTGHVLLVMSSLATGLTILVLSTLSSSLLVTQEVVAPGTADLTRFASGKDGTIELEPRRDTYFHTTSGYVYNASTSMWVSDTHVVLPFNTPASEKSNGSLPNGLWEAETRVLQMESECVPLTLGRFQTMDIQYYHQTDNLTFTYMSTLYNKKYPFVSILVNETIDGFSLQAEDGCTINIGALSGTEMAAGGGVMWSNLSSTHVSWAQFAADAGNMPVSSDLQWSPLWETALIDFSTECIGRNMLLVTGPWRRLSASGYSYWNNFKLRAELCTPKYYEATLPVNASISPTAQTVSFDKNNFAKRRRVVGKERLDLEGIEHFTFRGNRPDYLTKSNIYVKSTGNEGLTEALLSGAKFNYTSLINDEKLPARAARLRSRFFNELMLTSVTEQNSPIMEDVKARWVVLRRRILVVQEIAISLAVLLFVLTVYLLVLAREVSVRRRPLHLLADPATTIGLATYLNSNKDLVRNLSLDLHTSTEQASAVGPLHGSPTAYSPVHGGDSPEHFTRASTLQLSSSTNDWRPRSLRTLFLIGLILAFGALAAALIVLRHFSQQGKLYRSVFVYKVDVEIFKATISPFSLLATFIAVGLALWWDVMEKNMRLLQPYLSMTTQPRVTRRGTGLTYQSSYWVGAAFKAASNKDWLLSMVTIGTTLSQVLVIAIAAVFERDPGVYSQSAAVSRMMTARITPLTYEKRGRPSDLSLASIMTGVTGDWMYSALDQMVLGSQSPAWSRDGWVFAPVDLSLLPAVTSRHRENPQGNQQSDASLLASASNVTLDTMAMRARLQCKEVPIQGDTWLTDEVAALVGSNTGLITNMSATNLNITGKMLPSRLFVNTTYSTPVFATPQRILCCANETSSQASAVAYWSFTNETAWWAQSTSDELWTGLVPTGDDWPSGFMIKWITGPAYTTKTTIYTNNLPSIYTPLQFSEAPSIQALACKPVIEQVRASVTVARSSAQVLDFKLLGERQPRSDVWKLAFTNVVQPPLRPYETPKPPYLLQEQTNYTVEMGFGTYFMTQLLKGASIANMGTGASDPLGFENLLDERFNIRDTSLGLNMDFPSYSNYFLANKDSKALLDEATLLNHSQKTFQTFFQHFASNTKWTDGEPIVYKRAAKDSKESVQVTTTDRIEVLAMVDSATWLCLAIIFVLMIILITLTISLRIVYPPTIMSQKVETLADMLNLISGSDELLARVEGISGYDLNRSSMRTRLGWFKDQSGDVRWGIEVEDAVDWVERPT